MTPPTHTNPSPALTGLDAAGHGAMVTQLAEGAEGKVTVGAVTHVAVAVLNHWMLTQPSWAVDHVHHHR